jgi:hypothetical protein
MAVSAIGMALFVTMWPWLYHDTANRLLYYVLMASRFKDRPQFYLGQTLPHVPWHYPFVITLAVVPVAITTMYMLGIFRVLRQHSEAQRREIGRLFLLNALAPLLFAATGLQAAYSGERHFIPAYPYLACLAGIGFGTTFSAMTSAWHRASPAADPTRVRLVTACLLALLLLPALWSMARLHPYQLSYYSELVGGLPGATRLGLETTFWCESYQEALPYLDANAQDGASVWAENPFVLRFYQGQGMLRSDLKVVGGDLVAPTVADYVVAQTRETGYSYVPEIVAIMRQYEPAVTVSREGVAVLHLYELPQ